MVGEAGAVEWIVTGNEVEALQLEVSMIKQHQPRFNVRYRDDKSYPYLAVTLVEEVPRAMVVRGRKKKGNRYWGPYAHAYAIRDTLDLLLRVFPIRSCSQGVFDRARRARRPCLLYDIGRCSAPCTGFVSAEGHGEIVRRFSEFMDGDHATVLKELNAGMQAASEGLEFERAARMRDQIAAVRRVIEKQQMVTEKGEDIDVVAWAGDELESAFQVFFVRKGRMVGRKGFIVDRVEDLSDEELVESFLETLYSEQDDFPKQVITPVAPKDAEVIEEWLSLGRGSRVVVRVPERGDKRALLETVEQNAKEAFARNRLRRAGDFASRSVALNGLQTHLELPEAPLRIECFDISNLGPSEVVGSMVVFEDALPKKSDYRKFKVRSIPGQDDVGAMREVIERRFARLLEEETKPRDKSSRFAYRPGLVIVDGGKGQLNAALEAMKEVGVVDVPVAALAKRYEEVYLPGEGEPRVIPRGSEALYLLQRIRDEAHRFAVTYQRARRTKAMTRSVLDRLPGVGAARRKALVKHFGSAKGVLDAGVDELAGVPGISRVLAERIYEHIRRSA
jgi:excinuclease ABC subunit C